MVQSPATAEESAAASEELSAVTAAQRACRRFKRDDRPFRHFGRKGWAAPEMVNEGDLETTRIV